MDPAATFTWRSKRVDRRAKGDQQYPEHPEPEWGGGRCATDFTRYDAPPHRCNHQQNQVGRANGRRDERTADETEGEGQADKQRDPDPEHQVHGPVANTFIPPLHHEAQWVGIPARRPLPVALLTLIHFTIKVTAPGGAKKGSDDTVWPTSVPQQIRP